MAFNDFVLWTDDPSIPKHHVKCIGCGSIIPTGIVRISEHWAGCTGKGFHDSLLKMREEKGSSLTEEDFKKLNQENWFNELKKIIWEEYGGKAELDNTNFEDWESYFEEGLTPGEAIIEDLKNL